MGGIGLPGGQSLGTPRGRVVVVTGGAVVVVVVVAVIGGDASTGSVVDVVGGVPILGVAPIGGRDLAGAFDLWRCFTTTG
jgi:hypothetical protein